MESNISLETIYNSGQCFRWLKVDDIYKVPLKDKILILNKETKDSLKEIYLDTFCDYNKMKKSIIATNPELKDIYNSVYGMRILNQPFFETCISFIISQNNNIPKIKSSINKICGGVYNQFPSAEELIKLLEKDSFGLGYRKDYIYEFCEKYLEGCLSNLEEFSVIKNYPNCKFNKPDTKYIIEELCSYKGIGPKVASCIALFSLGCKDSIPKDVWIKRAQEKYNIIWNEKYAGYQQQIIFYAMKNKI